MRPLPSRGAAGSLLACVLALSSAAELRAQPPDPLGLVSNRTDLLIEVPQPRKLIEAFTNLDLLHQLQQFEAVRELYDSTNARRARQLLAYYEKQFGLKWPELLDRLAGGGAVVAVKFSPNPAPTLVVIQSTDEQLLKKFAKSALEILEQELSRQEAKDLPEKGAYRDVETVRLGKNYAAVAGSALVLTNSEAALKQAIDAHLDKGKNSLAVVAGVAEGRKLLPKEPLAWVWLNMDTLHKLPQAKEIFNLPRNNFQVTVLFAGLLDVARRSPFLAAGFYRRPEGFLTTVRMPQGRAGMAEGVAVHVPPADQPGSLPLLEPKSVLFSDSYFLDIPKFWQDRAKLFNEKQVKGLEEFDKNSAKFLLGKRFSQLLSQAGPYQRIVVANQLQSGYRTVPGQRIPAFALVVSLREPAAFSKSLEGILRGAGLIASLAPQFKVKLVEEKHGKYTIVGYRFPEDAESLKQNPNTIRYNFSPCFVTVGDQFVACSTLELCHELVDLLDKEIKETAKKSSAPSERGRLYAGGAADALQAVEETLLAQAILDQALPPNLARQQVRAFIDWVRRLGVLRLESAYGEHDFSYNIELRFGGRESSAQSVKQQRPEAKNKQ